MNPYESPQLDSLQERQQLAMLPPDRERFGILHVTLFAIGLGIYLGSIVLKSWILGWSPLPAWSWIDNPHIKFFSSVSIAAVLLAVYRRWTSAKTFPKHFGHWLLLWDGVGWITNQPLEVLLLADPSAESKHLEASNPNSAWIVLLRAVFHLVNIAMIALAVRHSSQERHWRRYGYIRLAFACWTTIQTLFIHTGNLWVITSLVVLLTALVTFGFCAAVVMDLRNSGNRDYLHWLGILVEAYFYNWQFISYSMMLARTAMGTGNEPL
jgi:hypothetical protein